jgi:Lysozyme like domain
MAVTGWNVTYTAVGIVLLYSGYKGTKLTATVTDLFKGQLDSTDDESLGGSSSSSDASATSGYSVTGGYSQSDLITLWTSNGGPSDTAAFAAEVALAESSGSATVTSSNPDGGTNVGIWQLDTKGVGSGHSVAELQNPDLNAAITIAATNGGINWSEWGDPVTDALPNHQYSPGA